MSSLCCTCRPPVVCVSEHTFLYRCATHDSTLEHPQFHAGCKEIDYTSRFARVGKDKQSHRDEVEPDIENTKNHVEYTQIDHETHTEGGRV